MDDAKTPAFKAAFVGEHSCLDENGAEVVCSPSGNCFLVAAGFRVAEWSCPHGQRREVLKVEGAHPICRAAFTPDCKRITLASRTGIPGVYDLGSGK